MKGDLNAFEHAMVFRIYREWSEKLKISCEHWFTDDWRDSFELIGRQQQLKTTYHN